MQLGSSLSLLYGNFQGYDFLKAYEKCYNMSFVCTLAVGALRTFWVKSYDFIEKSLKNGKIVYLNHYN
jgi:hypothetical protein